MVEQEFVMRSIVIRDIQSEKGKIVVSISRKFNQIEGALLSLRLVPIDKNNNGTLHHLLLESVEENQLYFQHPQNLPRGRNALNASLWLGERG